MQGLPVVGATGGCGANLKTVFERGFADLGRRAGHFSLLACRETKTYFAARRGMSD
jgi:hypothetical protein